MGKHTLAIAITNQCPLKCDFCCVPPGPGDLPSETVSSLVQQAIDIKEFRSIGFTGGEPLLRIKTIAPLGSLISSNGLAWGLTTGGGWANSKAIVDRTVKTLISADIHNITVSVDESHLVNRNADLVQDFIEQMLSQQVFVTVSCTSDKLPLELPIVLAPSPRLKVEFHYIAPVGYASENYEARHGFDFAKSKCPMSNALTLSVWPDGDVYPCCSTYVVNKDKDLVVGNVFDLPLADILSRALGDVYLCAIREVGFSGLICLSPELELWEKQFRVPVQDACHLCSQIAQTPNALSEIRANLSKHLA